MRIIQLTAENIKRLKAVTITPNEHINRITGANGSGKTSVLDAIEWALKGTSNVPSAPVRKGSKKAIIILKTEKFTVTRRFYEDGSRNGILAIEANDTHNLFQSPQKMLDSLLGDISFDPLEFIRMNAKEQFKVLRSLVKLDIDMDAQEADQKIDYEKRRELKKEVTALETRRDAIKVIEGLPKTKTDEAALVEELRTVQEYNADLERQRRAREERKGHLLNLQADIAAHNVEIEALRERIARMEEEIIVSTRAEEIAKQEIANWEPLPPIKDAGEVADRITSARKINEAIQRRDEANKLQNEIDRTEEKVAAINAAMEQRDQAKVKAIEEAEFPVKGLGFGEDEVLFEGLPFNQVSNADQIRASVAIGIAYNPKMRVMRIKDGSLLDDKSMAIIAEMCISDDIQVFIEKVDTTGKIGVYLEDGEVKAVNDEPEPQFAAPTPAKKSKAAKKITATA